MTTEAKKVLIVEDDDALRQLVEEELLDAGLQVMTAPEGKAALELLQQWSPDLVISDLRLPRHDGLWLLDKALDLPFAPGFIIMTAFGTVRQAVDALKKGADDFLTKPLDLDHLQLCVQRVLENRRLRADIRRYQEALGSNDFHGIVGRSPSMTHLFANLKLIARASGPVLISGESGTGKDLVAQAVHRESSRRQGPFVAVNCAAIPAELQESELFGHVAGAFTGAGKARKGLFAEAEGGTLFLDEIGEMPLELQAKLLRILQDGRVRPVGSNREAQVDVRILAATNRNLEEDIKTGRFREDLYFRLETFKLEVPPLRDRGDDLELLTGRFIQLLATQMGRSVTGITENALAKLRGYSFPGNVRELRNALERAIAFCAASEITADCLPDRIRRQQLQPSAEGDPFSELTQGPFLPTLEEMANRYTAYVLDRCGGNKRKTSLLLDISRATLYRRLGIRDHQKN